MLPWLPSLKGVPTPVLQVGQSNVSGNTATIPCTFLDGSSHYCMVCCSTDPSVPPDSSVYNISTTRGTEVTVSLQGLTSGQMYYCKAAATNTNSNNCAGPVVGGVKVFFSFISGILVCNKHAVIFIARFDWTAICCSLMCRSDCVFDLLLFLVPAIPPPPPPPGV